MRVHLKRLDGARLDPGLYHLKVNNVFIGGPDSGMRDEYYMECSLKEKGEQRVTTEARLTTQEMLDGLAKHVIQKEERQVEMERYVTLTVRADLDSGGVVVERADRRFEGPLATAAFSTIGEAAKQVAKTLKDEQRRWDKLNGLVSEMRKTNDELTDTQQENDAERQRLNQKRQRIEEHMLRTKKESGGL